MDRSAYLFDPRPLSDTSVLRGRTFGDVIDATVAAHPQATAIIDGGVRLTYAALDRRANALAGGLARDGIVAGTVVGVQLANGWEFIATTIALARLGAVALPLHPPYRARELVELLNWTAARALICSAAGYARGDDLRAACANLQLVVSTGAPPVEPSDHFRRSFAAIVNEHAGERPPRVTIAPDDPLSLNPTSGTESLRPKICIHTHDGLLSNSRRLAARTGLTPADRVLCSGGFTHLFGASALQSALISGAAIVTQAAFDASAWLDLAEREGVTHALAVPPQLLDLVAEQRARPRFLALREVRTGGAAIDRAFADAVRSTLGGTFTIQWGMSELGAGSTTLPGSTFDVPTLGTPLDGVEVRAVDGELWYRGADVFRGYLGDPETTASAVTTDGWIRTGDLATIEADGSLTFNGRRKDVINRGGFKISAYEIERLLATMPAIRQLAVVAVADPRMGEKAAVVCSVRDGAQLQLAQITAHLDALGVAKIKWPEHLIVLDELPTTATGKVAKSAVRAMVSSEAAGSA